MSDNSKPTKIGILVLALAAFAKAGDLQQHQLTSTSSPSCQQCNDGSSNDKRQGHSSKDHENNNQNYGNGWKNNNKGNRWGGHKVLNNYFPVVTPVIPPYTPGYGYQPQIGAGGPQYWGFYGSELATSQYPVAVPRVYTTAPQLVPVSGLTTPPVTQNDQASQVLPIYQGQDDSNFIPDIRTAIPVSAPGNFYQSRPALSTERLTITPLQGQANQVFVVKQASQPTVIVSKNTQFSTVTSAPSNYYAQQPINQASQSYAPNYDQKNININLNINGQSVGKNANVSFNSGSSNLISAPVIPQAPQVPETSQASLIQQVAPLIQQAPQVPTSQSASSYYLSSPNIVQETSTATNAPLVPQSSSSYYPSSPNIVQETSYVPTAPNAPPSATTYAPQYVAQENQATSYVPTGYKPTTTDVKYPSNDVGYLPNYSAQTQPQQTQTQSVTAVSYNLRKSTGDVSTGSANPNN